MRYPPQNSRAPMGARRVILTLLVVASSSACLVESAPEALPCKSDEDCPLHFACSEQGAGQLSCQALTLNNKSGGNGDPVSFSATVQPIFQAKCGAGCHS